MGVTELGEEIFLNMKKKKKQKWVWEWIGRKSFVDIRPKTLGCL